MVKVRQDKSIETKEAVVPKEFAVEKVYVCEEGLHVPLPDYFYKLLTANRGQGPRDPNAKVLLADEPGRCIGSMTTQELYDLAVCNSTVIQVE